MHSLLQRQIRKYLQDNPQFLENCHEFINIIDQTYSQFDDDRTMLERSLELSSQELIQANSEMRAIFQVFPDLFFLLDEEGKILDFKSGSQSDLYLDSKEFLGKNIKHIPLGNVSDKIVKAFEECKETGAISSIEYFLEFEGEQKYFEARFVPVKNNQVISIIRNITNRKNAEKEYQVLASVVKYSSELVGLISLDGRIIFLNEAGQKMLGIDPDDFSQIRMEDVITEKFQQDIEHDILPTIRQGENWEGDLQYRNMKTGELIDVHNIGFLIKDNISKEPLYFANISLDITKQKEIETELKEQAKILERINDEIKSKNQELTATNEELLATQEKLVTSEKRFRSLSELLPAGIVEIDGQGVIKYANSFFKELFQIEIDKDSSVYLTDLLPVEKENMYSCFKELQLKEVCSKNFEITISENEKKWINVSFTAMLTGQENRYVGVIHDITEVKKAEEEIKMTNEELLRAQQKNEENYIQLEEKTKKLEEFNVKLHESEEILLAANKKLKKLDELKSAFLNITSHELRTPMTSIQGYVQMILKHLLGEVSEQQEKALHIVLRNIIRLDHLIQDILDVSRLESGTMKFIPEKTNIAELIKETEETMISSAKEKNINLQIDILEELPELIVDNERIKQVLINIINNAIKFSPEYSVIHIRLYVDTENITFEIQDFGRGIPPKYQNDIFKTFYQVDGGMDRKFGGVGLGLSICRGIIMAHGGTIWVESEGIENKGSTFKFTLPISSITDVEERFKKLDLFQMDL